MSTKYYSLFILFGALALSSCKKEYETDNLAEYLAENGALERADLIACAAGTATGLDGTGDFPTSVFFYPVDGATDFRYFEATNLADSLDFSKYTQKFMTDSPVFNGYLWKFNNTAFIAERMGVVTFKTDGKIHVCTPIRMKTNPKPTEINPGLLTVTENGINPEFEWEDGLINESVIYFQVISDLDGNLISGTYTYEKNFTFYDLSNVVLNIKDVEPAPALLPNKIYNITMMAVSEDNWVNLLCEKEFSTAE
ncbi:MAG: hypothetical protein GQ574_25070 [Crocinitomix sp.]|nr:hypothetical protein [Crocinitomix sp.]